ncbi:uroporphyrinogen-III synthase [Azospirillum doebereinerae]|uniref:Uroporphyrinogen-III synthase n=2 Tax=Azospirillum doebereinerae TaxID=92933 RepID=A0A3S0WW35_9PROT|nr:uroporphyrinogen-III synthase [Azospirillum doebereinerae]MCG5243035.1 uroporphyrinogen-III synthase [Azospirillum doebereinerae]RUQ65886.1 uroporphyrinogen-III synthase [Azospirillum doebereinerae]
MEDAEPLVRRLDALGFACALEPMLSLVWLDGPEPDLTDVQALLFTSANGVRGYARRTGRRDRPVYAVGDATATAAREAGFTQVESASGDVYALAELVRARLDPAGGGLLHVAGSKVAGDLAGLLGGAGFALRREALYDALPAGRLSEETATIFRTSDLNGVLFFSPRTARSFVKLLAEAGLVDRCRTVDAFCLSPAVAEAARAYGDQGVTPWRSVRVAPRPEQDALLGLLPKTD